MSILGVNPTFALKSTIYHHGMLVTIRYIYIITMSSFQIIQDDILPIMWFIACIWNMKKYILSCSYKMRQKHIALFSVKVGVTPYYKYLEQNIEIEFF